MYQGIVLADFSDKKPHSRYHYELKVLTFFIQALHEQHEHFFLCQSWQMKDLRAFQWHNYHSPEKGTFKIDLRYTGILDLDIIKDKDFYISKEIRDSNKQDYQKAIKNHISIEDSKDIELLLEIYKQTFERQGIVVQEKDIQIVRNITEASLKNNFGKLFFAKTKDGEVSNATLFLYDNFCAYYLIGANSPLYRKSGASAMLMIHNIFYAKELGKKYVDFVGINSPQRGEFKLSFNAEPKPYFHLTI
jgi:lipid II:glycine glycyltransferase (peptidoglycan interpeptide bridge formation enzyme)